jgi:hypothetical protein
MAKNKRTTAQRRAAAKEAWRLRRLKSANTPTPVKRTADKLPLVVPWHGEPLAQVDATAFRRTFETAAEAAKARDPSPSVFGAAMTAVATREGSELFVTISGGGSLHRHKVSAETMRKLGLDCLQLVG